MGLLGLAAGLEGGRGEAHPSLDVLVEQAPAPKHGVDPRLDALEALQLATAQPGCWPEHALVRLGIPGVHPAHPRPCLGRVLAPSAGYQAFWQVSPGLSSLLVPSGQMVDHQDVAPHTAAEILAEVRSELTNRVPEKTALSKPNVRDDDFAHGIHAGPARSRTATTSLSPNCLELAWTHRRRRLCEHLVGVLGAERSP